MNTQKKRKWIWIPIIAIIVILGFLLYWFFLRNLWGTSDEVLIAQCESAYDAMQQEYDQFDVNGKPYEFIKKYPDMVGWLKIPKTKFSYPVMQNPRSAGSQNDEIRQQDYYLHRDVHGNYSFYGTPFIDDRCTIFSDNRIIYGHNIVGKRYFGYLHNYMDKDFYKEHPYLKYRDVFESANYEILSVIETDIHSFVYDFIDIGNGEDHTEGLKRIIDASKYKTTAAKRLNKKLKAREKKSKKVNLTRKHDEKETLPPLPLKLITLSTCRGQAGGNERLLIVAARSSDLT